MNECDVSFYVGLWWENDELGDLVLSVYAGFYAGRKKVRDAFFDLAKKQKQVPDSWNDGEGVYIGRVLSVEDATRFDDTLNDLIGVWAGIGIQCGGILKFAESI